MNQITVDCTICYNTYNCTTRKSIQCQYCVFTACRSCCEQHLLDQRTAVCMDDALEENGKPKCAREWTRKFLSDNFTAIWLKKKWFVVTSQQIYEQEVALLPATVVEVEHRKIMRGLTDQLRQIVKRKRDIELLERRIKHQIYMNRQGGAQAAATATTSLICGRPCPNGECRGFLSTRWRCGMCEQWTCSKCHVVRGPTENTPHTCNLADAATVQLLATDTKRCPKCSTSIYKISGCDQMWCTQCHTAFSWRTGKIQTRIHNPHYYEWQREHGGELPRNAGDMECGRNLGDMRALRQFTRLLHKIPAIRIPHALSNVLHIIRGAIHVERVCAPRFQTDHVVNNIEVRIKYLQHEIDENMFRLQVARRDKAHQKKKNIHNVLQLWIQAICDIVHRAEKEFRPIETMSISCSMKNQNALIFRTNAILSEVSSITKHCNVLLKTHATVYKSKVYELHDLAVHGYSSVKILF